MRALITAASRHGSTAEIADEIGRVLVSAGVAVEVIAPCAVDLLEGYDAVVIGSAVYYGRWLPEAVRLIDRNETTLRRMAVWLFSVGPLDNTTTSRPPTQVAGLVRAVGAREHRTFAGVLARDRRGLLERLVASVVHSPCGDFRDWAAIRRWASAIAGELAARAGASLDAPASLRDIRDIRPAGKENP